MPVTEITKDPEALTMTVTAEFAADPDRVWRLYEDPRQIERWWGPPGYPATFVEHELGPGGRSHYFMTSPEGERYHGIWTVVDVDAPRSFTIDDEFADEHGKPDAEMGTTRMAISLAPGGAGTVVTALSTFDSRETLEKQLAMGMEEGLRQAMDQIDGILAEDTA